MRYKLFSFTAEPETPAKYFIESIKSSANCFDERVSAYPAIIQSNKKWHMELSRREAIS